MTTEGYVIARSRNSKQQYFTTSSAYDRPRWIAVSEATVYFSPEQAQKAAVKLGVAGAYGARVLSLKEAMELEMPDDKQQQDPNAQGDEMDVSFGPGEDGKTEMTADEQQEPCEQCGHEPCTCEGGDGDGDTDDEGGDIDQEIEDHFSGGEAEIDPQNGELDAVVDDENPDQAISRTEGLDMTVKTITYKDSSGSVSLDDPDMKNADDKVSVPSSITSELRTAIAKFEKEAEDKNEVDDTRASYCMTVASAFKQLADDLAQGTSAGMKMAQIHLTSWMSPLQNDLPVEVKKFVYAGGKKSTLKDLFSAKTTEKKMVAESTSELADRIKYETAIKKVK